MPNSKTVKLIFTPVKVFTTCESLLITNGPTSIKSGISLTMFFSLRLISERIRAITSNGLKGLVT